MANFFSRDEIGILVSALETYDEAKQTYIRADLKHTLIHTSLHKLMTYSVLTNFTKQEYSVMYFALDHVANSFVLSGYQPDDELLTLLSKIETLAS